MLPLIDSKLKWLMLPVSWSTTVAPASVMKIISQSKASDFKLLQSNMFNPASDSMQVWNSYASSKSLRMKLAYWGLPYLSEHHNQKARAIFLISV